MVTSRSLAPSARTKPLSPWIQRRIGARLRSDYGDYEGQPLPDDQVDLLLRLRQKERELQRK